MHQKPVVHYTKRQAPGKLTAGEKRQRIPTPRANVLKYLKWYYRKDKTLQKINIYSAEHKITKDKETGIPRFVTFTWGGQWNHRKRRYAGGESYTVEIPHWDFDQGYTQISVEDLI